MKNTTVEGAPMKELSLDFWKKRCSLLEQERAQMRQQLAGLGGMLGKIQAIESTAIALGFESIDAAVLAHAPKPPAVGTEPGEHKQGPTEPEGTPAQ